MSQREECRSSEGAAVEQRRRFPRVEIDGGLCGTNVTAGLPVVFRNVSLGGFLTLSATPVEIDSIATFAVRQGHGDMIRVEARAVHCHPANPASTAYLVGWEAHADAQTRKGLEWILDHVTTAVV